MGSRPPSRTTGPGRKPSRPGEAGPGPARHTGGTEASRPAATGLRAGRQAAALLLGLAPLVVALLAVTGSLLAGVLLPGCSGNDAVPAHSGDTLGAGTTYSADLDGDGVAEQIIVNRDTASLTIADGESVYRSRDRWQVVAASLGDTDRDGLLEVVTLVDDEEGRHLGLFAYFGGEYRERLVTSEIAPRPVDLEVLPDGRAGNETGQAAEVSGDLVVLTQEPAAGETTPHTIVLRWNGFSFTSVPGTTGDAVPIE